MRPAVLFAAAVVAPMAGGNQPARRLQTVDPYDFSCPADGSNPGCAECATHQPEDSFYCNSLQGMEQGSCTCGSCDQNKQEVPSLTLPSMPTVGSSAACGGLCTTGFNAISAEQRAQRASLCVFPNGDESQDGVCKQYSCEHFAKSDCGSMQPMLMFMDPTATPADHYDCESLTCVECPQGHECRTHPQSGCMYHWDASNSALDPTNQCVGIDGSDDADCDASAGMGKQACEGTLRCEGGTTGGMLDQGACESDGGTWSATRRCQTGLQAQFDLWRYVEPSPETDPAAAEICGQTAADGTQLQPMRGKMNIDFIPGVSDASEKCVCESCYMTMTDHTNRNPLGGYNEFCTINVCNDEGVVQWNPSAGTELVITSDNAGRGECDDNDSCKTFAELAALTGASPEILMAFMVVSGLLVLYCLINIACDKGGSKEYDSDEEDDEEDNN